jgi:hypothetical protein
MIGLLSTIYLYLGQKIILVMKILKLLKLMSKGSKAYKSMKYGNHLQQQYMGQMQPGYANPPLNQGFNPSQLGIGGIYNVSGIFPNGVHYNGTCTVQVSQQQGQTFYQFHWIINQKDHYTGIGQLNGNMLSVNFGAETPIVYSVGNNGSYLDGTYAFGSGRETLIRS